MFKPIPEHEKILFDNKCAFAFRTSSSGSVSRVVCGIIDQNTGIGFIEADGMDEQEAFNAAIRKVGKVARPFANEDAKALVEKDAEIAALKAQLDAAIAPPAPAATPAKTARRRTRSSKHIEPTPGAVPA